MINVKIAKTITYMLTVITKPNRLNVIWIFFNMHTYKFTNKTNTQQLPLASRQKGVRKVASVFWSINIFLLNKMK